MTKAPKSAGRTVRGNSKNGADDSVGYKKPPMHSRFKPGVSGNPRGRRKGVKARDVSKAVQEAFMREILVREGNETRRIPKVLALIETTLADAVRGDAKAKALAYKMATVFGVFSIKDQTTIDLSILTPGERATVAKGFDVLRRARVVLPSGHRVAGSGTDIFDASNHTPAEDDFVEPTDPPA